MIAAAPYPLHCSSPAGSFAGSQVLAIRRASGFSGSIANSPLGGTSMRRCQCSATTDTQLPVRSFAPPRRGRSGRRRRRRRLAGQRATTGGRRARPARRAPSAMCETWVSH